MRPAADHNAKVRRAIRKQPWRPGTDGKGLVTSTGTTYIWQERLFYDGGKRLYIYHYDAIEAGLADESAIHFYIDPDARVDGLSGKWATDRQVRGVRRKVDQLITESFS